MTVNGKNCEFVTEISTTLVDAIRDHLDLLGTKVGCAHGHCGACTVLVNGVRCYSCLALAVMHDGAELQTIEGVAQGGQLHPLQQAFIEHDAFQCGFCTPGQIMSGLGLLSEGAPADATEVRHAMNGNICRCGAYENIASAVLETAKRP